MGFAKLEKENYRGEAGSPLGEEFSFKNRENIEKAMKTRKHFSPALVASVKVFFVVIIMHFIVGYANAAPQNPIEIDEMDFDVAKTLKKREEAVQAKEEELEKQEKKLASLKKEVDEKLTRLVTLQQEVKAQLAELSGAQEAEFRNLVKVYSTMSASKASPLLNRMDDPTVTKILRAMKADLVAKIIPKLNPEKAVSVSKKLGMLNKISAKQ